VFEEDSIVVSSFFSPHALDTNGEKPLSSESTVYIKKENMKKTLELFPGLLGGLIGLSLVLFLGFVDLYGIYHSFSKHNFTSGVISVFVPPFALYRAAEGFYWHEDVVNTDDFANVAKDPYSSDIESYTENWEPRFFQCLKYDYIPEFTLGYYSDPREDEIELLCSCIDKNIEKNWVRDTGRKLKKGEEVTNILYREGFPARLGEKIKFCTKDARRD
jgi:hypothetical protein